MKRRDFIRLGSAGSVFIGSGLCNYTLAGMNLNNKDIFCYQPEIDVPVILNVDVLVVGGSTAAVSAAVSARKQGVKVALLTDLSYLGDNVAGTYNYWKNPKDSFENQLAAKMFTDEGIPTPLHIKSVLDDELIDNDIPFFYSCYVTDLLVDESDTVKGVVIGNRSGIQVIKARTIIDATQFAIIARLADAKFNYQDAQVEFKLTKLSLDAYAHHSSEAKKQLHPMVFEDKSMTAFTFSTITSFKNSYAQYCEIEDQLRAKAFETEQVDTADLLEFTPSGMIVSKGAWQMKTRSLSEIPIDPFSLKNRHNIIVLSKWAELNLDIAEFAFLPGNATIIGEKIGKETAVLSKTMSPISTIELKLKSSSGNHKSHYHTDIFRKEHILEDQSLRASSIPVLGKFDVVVMGGGTAGASAGISASRQGAKTLVVEYLHGLGGVGTMGLITSYFHGYRKGFSNEIDEAVRKIGGDSSRQKEKDNDWVRDWKMEYYRREIRKGKGEIWYGSIGLGAVMEKNEVRGIVIATPAGKGIILADTVIDASGSGDIAIAAGADYEYTGPQSVAVQGAGLPFNTPGRDYTNTDWTFIDDTDIYDIWRTFVVAKKKFKGNFDVGKLLQTRERKRIKGEYEVTVLDMVNNRRYPDTISIHKSSFDTHGFTVDPFFTLKPPTGAHIDFYAHVPLRALIPKGLKNILVTGLGASASRDAMPVIRMQPCVQNQGYAVGYMAATAALQGVTIHDLDFKSVQQHLIEIDNLPGSVISDTYMKLVQPSELKYAVVKLKNELEGLEIVMSDIAAAMPMLNEQMDSESEFEDKLVYAHVMGILGNDAGYELLESKIKSYSAWDKGWNYTGMGQFGECMSRLDSYIKAIGSSRRAEALWVLAPKARMLTAESEFSHFRAISEACSNIGTSEAANLLFDLFDLPGLSPHSTTNIRQAIISVKPSTVDTSIRNQCLKELFLAGALYKCGDKQGLGEHILKSYANDLRGHYARYAQGILEG